MKKIFSTLLILAVMLTSTVAMAAFREDITEGADLVGVKKLAVALPMHYRVETTEPTVEEFTKIIFDASKKSKLYVISYDEIATSILKDTGIDIRTLNDLEARKVYNDNIGKYADAFVTVTTANSIKKVQFFFEVQNAKNLDMMYVLTTQSGSIKKNSKDYGKACEEFYKKFDAAVAQIIKDSKKK